MDAKSTDRPNRAQQVCAPTVSNQARRTSDLHTHRWSATGARYFITSCTHERRRGLATADVITALLTAVQSSDSLGDTTTIAFTAMPDHIHWLLELGPRLSLGRVLARFKAQTRTALFTSGLSWQRDFFEHRLRSEESVEDYAFYVFLNPHRANLISSGIWPGWWSARPESLQFLGKLTEDGTPPGAWISERVSDELITGE
jgi:REP element-mobilizing transposase RayT